MYPLLGACSSSSSRSENDVAQTPRKRKLRKHRKNPPKPVKLYYTCTYVQRLSRKLPNIARARTVLTSDLSSTWNSDTMETPFLHGRTALQDVLTLRRSVLASLSDTWNSDIVKIPSLHGQTAHQDDLPNRIADSIQEELGCPNMYINSDSLLSLRHLMRSRLCIYILSSCANKI